MPVRNNVFDADEERTMLIEERLRGLLISDPDLSGKWQGEIYDYPVTMVSQAQDVIVGVWTNREYMPAQTLSTRRLDPEIIVEVLVYLPEAHDRALFSSARRRLLNLTTLLRRVMWQKYRFDPTPGDTLWYRMTWGTPVTQPFFGENNAYLMTRTTFTLSANKGA